MHHAIYSAHLSNFGHNFLRDSFIGVNNFLENIFKNKLKLLKQLHRYLKFNDASLKIGQPLYNHHFKPKTSKIQ